MTAQIKKQDTAQVSSMFSSDFLESAATGVRFVPCRFDNPDARNLSQIVSPGSKRVLKLHPYDMPQNGMEVLAFCLNYVLAAESRGMIEPLFGNAERGARLVPRYYEMTLELLRTLENSSGVNIQYRKPK